MARPGLAGPGAAGALSPGRARPRSRHPARRRPARDAARAGVPRGASHPPGRDQRAPAPAPGGAPRRPACRAGTPISPRCRPGRCSCSPTSSSTPCRCISWSRPRAAGSSAASPWPRAAGSCSASRPTASPLGAALPEAPAGAVAEVSPARAALARAIGGRIARDGGVALVIDYGAWAEGPTGDTLQATRDHAPCDPLDAPGTADLTTHVDFRALALAACEGGAAVYGPVPQGTFLTSFGIHLRTAKLLERAAPAQQRAAARGAVPSDRPERHGRAVQGRGAGPSGGAGAARLRRADAPAMLTAAHSRAAGRRPPRLLHPRGRRERGRVRVAELRLLER